MLTSDTHRWSHLSHCPWVMRKRCDHLWMSDDVNSINAKMFFFLHTGILQQLQYLNLLITLSGPETSLLLIRLRGWYNVPTSDDELFSL